LGEPGGDPQFALGMAEAERQHLLPHIRNQERGFQPDFALDALDVGRNLCGQSLKRRGGAVDKH
jgi:hypothetical protein